MTIFDEIASGELPIPAPPPSSSRPLQHQTGRSRSAMPRRLQTHSPGENVPALVDLDLPDSRP